MEVKTSGKPIDSVMERVLCMNILSSDYFKELYRLKTYHDVINEIYNQVDHVEPWMTGNCRGPSTAFCLLYKFFTMKLTVKQMQGLLNHRDSPYIRAVGFLYLRYLGDPKSLWGWFEEYITDDEEFSPSSSGKVTTMGLYVRDLLLDQHYFDTLLPRIPVPIMRQVTSNLEQLKISAQPAGVTRTGSRHGSEDAAHSRKPPSVKSALSVSFGQRAPHRASTRDSSPVRRNLSTSRESRGREDEPRVSQYEYRRHRKDKEEDTLRHTERERERSRDRDTGGDRFGDRSRDRSLDRSRRERDWEEDRSNTKQRKGMEHVLAS
ncbi:hypothetical protein R1sor_023033 [Riccia sorocarpa]|uniref:Pre-mRNA-splicing factor 38 n=1 Tax=Riccia sorocarpa TaxID=122646 RepID=A0ABD3GPJ7_9MARC